MQMMQPNLLIENFLYVVLGQESISKSFENLSPFQKVRSCSKSWYNHCETPISFLSRGTTIY